MDNIFLLKIPQRLQNLYREPSDQWQGHTPKIISFYELVQIDRKQLERDDQMLSEVAWVFDSDDVHLVVRVVVPQVSDYVQFDLRLVFEFLFVPYDLDRNDLPCFMVFTF